MTDTIKPPWAIAVWANADHIFAELPAIGGHTCHLVKFPNTPEGFAKLMVLARARDSDSKLGTKGDPTQFQLDKIRYDEAMVRRPKAKYQYTSEQRIIARDILRKQGLI